VTTPPDQIAIETSAPPRFFYGWVMAGVSTLAMIATGPGQTVVVSQFNISFRDALGISASALSIAYMIGTLSAALPLVLVGKASDRFGPRLVMGVVAGLFGLACAAAGQVQSLITLTLAFFFLRFLGQGALGLVSGHMLALWFERRLGTANGIKLVLMQLGMAILPGVALALIDAYGWRAAYATLGLLVWVLVLPLVILVARNHPHQVGQRIDGDPLVEPPGHEHDDESPEIAPTGHRHVDPAFTLPQAVRTGAYWIVTLSLVLNGLIGTALLFHVQPLLDWRALDPTHSDAILRSWSLTMMVCVLPAGWLADRLSPRWPLALSLALLAGSTLLTLAATSVALFHAAYACFGVSQALGMAVGPPTIARYFGRAHHGAIRGSVTRLGVAGTGLGPVILGLSLDELGGFAPGLAAMAFACVPLAAAALLLRRPAPPA